MGDKLEEVLKKSESKVITPEFISEVKKSFDEAVDAKAIELSKDKIDEHNKLMEKSINDKVEASIKVYELEQKEKFDEAVESEVTIKLEETKKELTESNEKELNELKIQVLEKADYAIKKFVDENTEVWEKEAELQEARAIKQDFNGLCESFGIKISSLDESDKLKEANSKLDEALVKIKDLESTSLDESKIKMLDEAKKELTAVKQDKLDELMKDVKFVDEKQFKDKIELFVSAINENKKPESKKPDADTKLASWEQ